MNHLLLIACSLLTSPPAQDAPPPVAPKVHKIAVGGEGGWDYLTVDSEGRRLYVSRGNRVVVLDLDQETVVGELADAPGVHGIAVVPEFGKGFISNGSDSSVTVFDLKTLKVTGKIKASGTPDAILYDPASKRVITFNHGTNDGTAIDPASEQVATKRYAAPDASLGTLSLRTADAVLCADLRATELAGDGRVFGLIGMAFLKDYVLTIDIGRSRLRLERETMMDKSRAIPIHFDGSGVPLIEVALPGEAPQRYELDSGFSGFGTLSVMPDVFDRLAGGGRLREVRTTRKATVAGDFVTRWSATDSAMFAGVKLHELRIDEAKQSPGQVGMGAIRHMNLVLDFPRRQMWAKRVGWW